MHKPLDFNIWEMSHKIYNYDYNKVKQEDGDSEHAVWASPIDLAIAIKVSTYSITKYPANSNPEI